MRVYSTMSEVFACTHVPASSWKTPDGQTKPIPAHYMCDVRVEERHVSKSGRVSINLVDKDLKSEIDVPLGRDVVVELEARVAGGDLRWFIVGLKAAASSKKPPATP